MLFVQPVQITVGTTCVATYHNNESYSTADMFASGAVASVGTASFCPTLNRRRRSTRPSSSAVA